MTYCEASVSPPKLQMPQLTASHLLDSEASTSGASEDIPGRSFWNSEGGSLDKSGSGKGCVQWSSTTFWTYEPLYWIWIDSVGLLAFYDSHEFHVVLDMVLDVVLDRLPWITCSQNPVSDKMISVLSYRAEMPPAFGKAAFKCGSE